MEKKIKSKDLSVAEAKKQLRTYSTVREMYVFTIGDSRKSVKDLYLSLKERINKRKVAATKKTKTSKPVIFSESSNVSDNTPKVEPKQDTPTTTTTTEEPNSIDIEGILEEINKDQEKRPTIIEKVIEKEKKKEKKKGKQVKETKKKKSKVKEDKKSDKPKKKKGNKKKVKKEKVTKGKKKKSDKKKSKKK